MAFQPSPPRSVAAYTKYFGVGNGLVYRDIHITFGYITYCITRHSIYSMIYTLLEPQPAIGMSYIAVW